MLECMEIAEQVYKGGNTSKNTNRTESHRASHNSKSKGGEAASPTNTEKGRTGKRKQNYAGHMSNRTTGAKTFLVHGLMHSTGE